jgi:hypothetical protein
MKSKLINCRQLAETLAQAASVLPEQSPPRFTMKRVPTPPKPSPYVEMLLRRKYAVETLRSIKASPAEQMIELELMVLDDDGTI